MSDVSASVGAQSRAETLASVIVPTHQRRDSLRRLLAALIRQSVEASAFEVVAVVDGSTDGSVDLLGQDWRPLNLRVHVQPQRGRASACNAGLVIASGQIAVLVDDDMEPSEHWLAEHLEAHQEGEPVAVLGGVPSTRPSDTSGGRYLQRRFDRHLARLSRPGTAIGFRDVYTGNFSIQRNTLTSIGGFDEAFTEYGNEDGELAIRLMERGIRFVYRPSALAIQHQDKDLAQAFKDARAKGATSVALARRHPEAVGSLRLGRRGSARRRLIRRLLLGLTGTWSATPRVVTKTVDAFARLLSESAEPRFDRLFDVVLDYAYWLGVHDANGGAASASPEVTIADPPRS